jgi:hypothetical protein
LGRAKALEPIWAFGRTNPVIPIVFGRMNDPAGRPSPTAPICDAGRAMVDMPRGAGPAYVYEAASSVATTQVGVAIFRTIPTNLNSILIPLS